MRNQTQVFWPQPSLTISSSTSPSDSDNAFPSRSIHNSGTPLPKIPVQTPASD